MTNPYRCHDKDRLVAFLYGEASDGDRAAIEHHLTGCTDCASELNSLQSVRVDLAAWQPPGTDLGFRIVREPVTIATSRRWWQFPAWVPAAMAAALLVAVGAALANVQVEYGQGTVVVRSAWSSANRPQTPGGQAAIQNTSAPAAVAGRSQAGVTADEVRAALAALELRLRDERQQVRPQATTAMGTASHTPLDRTELLREVSALLDESERRQQRELALRLAQVVQDFDAQRRADLVRINQGFGQIEGLTSQEATRQREVLNYLMRTSLQK